MKTILVPSDFSKPAINALQFALDIARKSNGVVHLLHVVEIPVMPDAALTVLSFEESLLKEFKKKAEAEFKTILDKYNKEKVKTVTKVVFGTTAHTIVDYAEKESIDIIFMGSHGATGLREIFVGSNAEKIVRRSPVPVLVIKDFFKGPVTDIVFPNSLEPHNQEDLVMKIKALQAFFKAKLHLLWVNTPVSFTSDNITFNRLHEFAKKFMLKEYFVHVFNHTDEEEGVLQFTKMIKGNMIAMGTHGRKGLGHLVNGSLTEDIVNHTDRLIWTYRMKPESIEA